MDNTTIFETKNLRKSYGTTIAIDGISIRVKKVRFTGSWDLMEVEKPPPSPSQPEFLIRIKVNSPGLMNYQVLTAGKELVLSLRYRIFTPTLVWFRI